MKKIVNILLFISFILPAEEIDYIFIDNSSFLHDESEDMIESYNLDLDKLSIPNTWPILNKTPGFSFLFNENCFTNSDCCLDNVHLGVDIILNNNSPIVSIADGYVETIFYNSTGFGICIVINHGDNLYSIYGHLSKTSVVKGQTVEKIQIIGYSGNTGLSIQPCLHFALKYNNFYINPLYVLLKTL